MTGQMDIIIVTDNIRSLNNIGSIFRTADGLGVREIVLVGQSGYPPEPKITKTAIRAEEFVSWRYFSTNDDALGYLRQNHYEVVAVELAASAIKLVDINLKPKNKIALVFGAEKSGVAPLWLENADLTVYIPMKGEKASFNVATVVSMVVYELQRNYL